MKTVFPSNEIAHLWAHQTQSEARNGHGDNFSFRGTDIYSYWSNIGRIIKLGECAVFNSARYSVTTSKHQAWARRSASHYLHIFDLDTRHEQHCAFKPVDIVAGYRASAVDNLERAERARQEGNRPYLLGRARAAIAKADEARTYFKLRSKPFTVGSLARDVAKLSKERKEERKEERAESLRIAKEREARFVSSAIAHADKFLKGDSNCSLGNEDRKRLPIELLARLQAFEKVKLAKDARAAADALLAGTAREIAWNLKDAIPEGLKSAVDVRLAQIEEEDELARKNEAIERAKAFVNGMGPKFSSYDEEHLGAELLAQVNARRLEVNKEKIENWLVGNGDSYGLGDCPTLLRAKDGQMETTKGARVPLGDAQRAFQFAMIKRARGNWHKNGETCPIGHYQLDAVNEYGVVAGCHRVAWDEIERFARSQGWQA